MENTINMTSREYAINEHIKGWEMNKTGFVLGVKWADEHPVDDWTNIAVRTPQIPEGDEYVQILMAAKIKKGDTFIIKYDLAYFYKNGGYELYNDFGILKPDDMLFWRYIPKLNF